MDLLKTKKPSRAGQREGKKYGSIRAVIIFVGCPAATTLDYTKERIKKYT